MSYLETGETLHSLYFDQMRQACLHGATLVRSRMLLQHPNLNIPTINTPFDDERETKKFLLSYNTHLMVSN